METKQQFNSLYGMCPKQEASVIGLNEKHLSWLNLPLTPCRHLHCSHCGMARVASGRASSVKLLPHLPSLSLPGVSGKAAPPDGMLLFGQLGDFLSGSSGGGFQCDQPRPPCWLSEVDPVTFLSVQTELREVLSGTGP
ncbi:hypothetical protein CRENBAI_024026 [Crenichthys baileyi]|uniref:Uncharacterized protein n=1 Tax=Crenichthys baileyi TaxID=28760 RepID=A0AAV9RFA9_9TELE